MSAKGCFHQGRFTIPCTRLNIGVMRQQLPYNAGMPIPSGPEQRRRAGVACVIDRDACARSN